MSKISKSIAILLLSAALISPSAAQDILDRNGTPLQRDHTSPAQYVLPETLAALGTRRLSFDAKLSKIVQEEVEAAVEHYQALRGGAFVDEF